MDGFFDHVGLCVSITHMKIHSSFSEYPQLEQINETDSSFGAGSTSFGPVEMRSQVLWVVIAVSIVVVVNGVLSWF